MHLLKRLKKIKYTIILLLIGSAAGLFIYQNRKTKAVWRVEYSFRDDQGIQSFLHKDTLIIGKDFKYRNYTSSIADTLREEGIIRHELKVYAPQTATEENVLKAAKKLIKTPEIINVRFRTIIKKKEVILYSSLFGMVLGLFIDLLRNDIKQRNQDKE